MATERLTLVVNAGVFATRTEPVQASRNLRRWVASSTLGAKRCRSSEITGQEPTGDGQSLTLTCRVSQGTRGPVRSRTPKETPQVVGGGIFAPFCASKV